MFGFINENVGLTRYVLWKGDDIAISTTGAGAVDLSKHVAMLKCTVYHNGRSSLYGHEWRTNQLLFTDT